MISFIEFAEKCGKKLTPGQRVIGEIAYDNININDCSNPELAKKIFGNIEHIPEIARGIFVCVAGARAGKSSIILSLRAIHLAYTHPLTTLADGEPGVSLIVSANKDLATHTLKFIKGIINSNKTLKKYVVSENTECIEIVRPDGKTVQIRVLAASGKGAATRGKSYCFAALEEGAFFRDNDNVVSDEEVYNSISSRILTGGQLVMVSTPYAKKGLLYNFWRDNYSNPQSALIAHAPTLLLRDTKETRAIVERERLRDPDNAAREFDAEFLDNNESSFFNELTIHQAVISNIKRDNALRAVSGVDLAFKHDSSAQCIVQDNDGVYELVDVLELTPTDKIPLKPSMVLSMFGSNAKEYKCYETIGDSHYSETAKEEFNKYNIRYYELPNGASGKEKTYTIVRQLLNEGKIRLPKNDKLITQLKEVTKTPTSGGGLKITSPRRSGSHGDIVSALVAAIYQLHTKRPVRYCTDKYQLPSIRI